MSESEAVAAGARSRRERHHPEPARECPELGGWPLLGALPRIRREGMLPLLDSQWKQHGDVFRLRLGPKPAVVIAHPDAFERVLAGHKRNYDKGSAYDLVRLFLGDGLVTLEGEQWRSRRRLMQPYFHRAALQTMVDTMATVVERYLDDMQRRFPEGGRVDIHRELVRLTLEVVCTALFGPGVTGGDEIPYAILGDAVAVMNDKLGNPTPLWVPLPINRRFRRVREGVDQMVHRLIARARAKKDDPEVRSTLLGMLLDTVDAQGRPLSDQAIRDEVITLYVAGHETTALTMTWMFALMQGREDVITRLRDEADAVLGDRRPGFAQLPALGYTLQVLEEILRMRSPTAFVVRNALGDDNLCGARIRAGDLVMMFFWGLHHHPDYWPDPERFDPERFTPKAKAERDTWSYLPFSGGPRVCIGNSFALYEGQLIAAMMFRRATWEIEPTDDVRPLAAGTLRPSRPIYVRFQWR